MSDELLLIDKKDYTTTLTLNRPKRRNALNPELLDLLRQTLANLKEDPDTRIVCITGAGEKAFCAGADLLASMSSTETDPIASNKNFAFLLQDIRGFDKPIIAKVNGHCLGGGFGLALACDMIITRKGAKFGTPEVNVGLFPMMIGPLILEQLPKKIAYELMLCGGTFLAEEAETWGIFNKIVEQDALDTTVEHALSRLSSAAPLAQQHGKRALRDVQGTPFNQAVETLSERLVGLLQTEDAAEGISAFMQKRKPEWKSS